MLKGDIRIAPDSQYFVDNKTATKNKTLVTALLFCIVSHTSSCAQEPNAPNTIRKVVEDCVSYTWQPEHAV